MPQFDSIRFQPSRPLLKEITADRLNTILSEIRRNKPRGERGITVRHSGDGTYIGLAAKTGSGGSAPSPLPWDITVENSTENSYTLKIQPGTLAGVLPSNWDAEFTATADDLYYGIAKVTTDGQFVTGVEIDIADTPPQLQPPVKFGLAEDIDILFGLFKEGVSYNLTGGQNIDVWARNILTTTPETQPEPGMPAFDLWFRLQ